MTLLLWPPAGTWRRFDVSRFTVEIWSQPHRSNMNVDSTSKFNIKYRHWFDVDSRQFYVEKKLHGYGSWIDFMFSTSFRQVTSHSRRLKITKKITITISLLPYNAFRYLMMKTSCSAILPRNFTIYKCFDISRKHYIFAWYQMSSRMEKWAAKKKRETAPIITGAWRVNSKIGASKCKLRIFSTNFISL